MRRFIVVLGVGAAAAAVTVPIPATGQSPPPAPTLSADLSIGPMATGTARRPRAVRLRGELHVDVTGKDGALTGSRLYLPRGISIQVDSTPTCDLAVLRRMGPGGCPRRSRVGTARSRRTDEWGPSRVTFVNGGPEKIYGYTTVYRPWLIKDPVLGRIKTFKRGRWSHRIDGFLPAPYSNIGIGFPPVLEVADGYRFGIGRRPAGSLYLATDRRCRKGFLPYKVELYHHDGLADVQGTLSYSGRIDCNGREDE